jgi:hypothetical protein
LAWMLKDDGDPVFRLMIHYFEPSDLLYESWRTLSAELHHKGRLPRGKLRKYQLYFQLWLATLFVVVEGFNSKSVQASLEPLVSQDPQVRVYCSSIRHKMTQLGDKLRRFRNATFHFHETPQKLYDFLERDSRHEPIDWAEELHKEFRKLFSAFRIEKAVIQYFKQDEDEREGGNQR